MIFKPVEEVIVGLLFQALSLSPVDLFRFSKEVGQQVSAAWAQAPTGPLNTKDEKPDE